MQKFLPALKIVLLGSIGVLLVAVAMSLFFGNTSSITQLMFPLVPLIGGLAAYTILSSTSLAAAKCPRCATQQPFWRKPTSLRQGFFGGWTCRICKTEIDRNGRAVTQETAPRQGGG
jgi:hypothetical protein